MHSWRSHDEFHVVWQQIKQEFKKEEHPRLKLMIQGVFTGLRVLFWAVVLLVGCMYLLGVVTRTLFGNVDDLNVREEFSTVPAAMFTCFRCFTDGCAATDGTPLQEHLRPLAVFFRLLELCSILFQCFSMGKDVSMICHWWKECPAQERIDLCCTGYVCIAIPSDEILMGQIWVIWDEVGSHMVQLGDNCSPGWSQHGPSTGNMNLHQAPKEVISWCKLYTSPMPQAPGLLSHSYPQVMCSLWGLPHVQEHGWLWHSLARDWTCWSPMFPFFDKYTWAANDVSKH